MFFVVKVCADTLFVLKPTLTLTWSSETMTDPTASGDNYEPRR